MKLNSCSAIRYVHSFILSFSTDKRVLFTVNVITNDVRDGIMKLNKDIQISFDCTAIHGSTLSNRVAITSGPSTSNEGEVQQEGASASLEIVSTIEHTEDKRKDSLSLMEIATKSEENNNFIDKDKAVKSLNIISTNEPIEVDEEQSIKLSEIIVLPGNSCQLDSQQPSTSNRQLNSSILSIADTSTVQMANSDRQKIAIGADDLACLEPGVYLNDNVINAYLTHILAEKQRQPNMPKILLLDNFFLKTLSRDIDMKQSYSIATKKYGFKKALCIEMAHKKERLIKKKKIFDADFLVLPICHVDHWFMIIVCHLSKMNEVGCKILIFDSVHNVEDYYDEHLNVLLHFIAGSYVLTEMCKNGDVNGFIENLYRNIEMPNVPRQTNSTDCGLYLMEYLEKFFDTPVVGVNQNWSMLIEKKLMRYKRQKVKKILQSLME